MVRTVENVGVGSVFATFDIDKTGQDFDLSSSNEGDPVALSGDNEVDHGTDGDACLGQLISVQDDIAVVQVKGVVRVTYDTLNAPSLGGGVVVNGAGKVKGSASGRGLVLAIDATNETVDLLL